MPEDLAKAVAAEVRRLIAERGWSGRELAQRTGLPTNSVATKLRGDRGLDFDDLDRIAEALGVTVAHVVARAEAARSHPAG